MKMLLVAAAFEMHVGSAVFQLRVQVHVPPAVLLHIYVHNPVTWARAGWGRACAGLAWLAWLSARSQAAAVHALP
jgi:hypothetical protein